MEKKITSTDLYESMNAISDNAMDAIRGILNERLTDEHPSINLDYYAVNGSVDRYNFLGVDGDGYGKALSIFSIEKKGDDFIFDMTDEDGDGYEERDLEDFNTNELVWVLEMIEDTFDEVDEDYDGVFLSKDDFDYDYE